MFAVQHIYKLLTKAFKRKKNKLNQLISSIEVKKVLDHQPSVKPLKHHEICLSQLARGYGAATLLIRNVTLQLWQLLLTTIQKKRSSKMWGVKNGVTHRWHIALERLCLIKSRRRPPGWQHQAQQHMKVPQRRPRKTRRLHLWSVRQLDQKKLHVPFFCTTASLQEYKNQRVLVRLTGHMMVWIKTKQIKAHCGQTNLTDKCTLSSHFISYTYTI